MNLKLIWFLGNIALLNSCSSEYSYEIKYSPTDNIPLVESVTEINFGKYGEIIEVHQDTSPFIVILIPQLHSVDWRESDDESDLKFFRKTLGVQKEIQEILTKLVKENIVHYVLQEGELFNKKEIDKDNYSLQTVYHNLKATKEIREHPKFEEKKHKLLTDERFLANLSSSEVLFLKGLVKEEEYLLYKLGGALTLIQKEKISIFGAEDSLLQSITEGIVRIQECNFWLLLPEEYKEQNSEIFQGNALREPMEDCVMKRFKAILKSYKKHEEFPYIKKGILKAVQRCEKWFDMMFEGRKKMLFSELYDKHSQLFKELQIERNKKALEFAEIISREKQAPTVVIIYGMDHMFPDEEGKMITFQEICQEKNISYVIIAPQTIYLEIVEN